VTCLLVDVGGVLLSNGWDHHARRRAAKKFELDWDEMEDRHGLNFETFEIGKITLAEYLDRVVFHKQMPFTKKDFQKFMFAQSTEFPEMIDLISTLKSQCKLKIGIVNNESRELNTYRIDKFGLDRIADFFVSSCSVRMRKPDAEIFALALDIAHKKKSETVYIDNTALFVEVAEGLGIRGIVHTDHSSTRQALAQFGLQADE